MARVLRMLARQFICASVLVLQCWASGESRRHGHARCNCHPVDLVPLGQILHRHHRERPSLWQWYEATGKKSHQHRHMVYADPRSHTTYSFLQESNYEESLHNEECPCAQELYWAINTQKTVLSVISSLEEEKTDLEQTEKALAAKAIAELHLQASNMKVGVQENREERAEDDIALEAADLEQAQEATLATQDSSSGGEIDSLQQETAVVEQTDHLADIQSKQLDADVLEKKVAMEKMNHIAKQASVHVADMEVKSKIQSADIHEDRVPTELEINQAIRMLEEARPRVQTEEAQMVVEQCMHELQQALTMLAQVQRLEQRIEVQVNQNPELQPDSDEQASSALAPTPSDTVVYNENAIPADPPPEPSFSAPSSETPEVVSYSARRTAYSSREAEKTQLRRQLRGAAMRLESLEASFQRLESQDHAEDHGGARRPVAADFPKLW